MNMRILAAMLFSSLSVLPARAEVQPVFLATIGSPGSQDGQLEIPFASAVAANGDVYVVDTDRARIQKFDADGNFLLAWGSYGTNDGQFRLPRSIALDSDGNVYITEDGNNRVEKFDGQGHLLDKWGTEGSGPGQFEFGYLGSAIAIGTGGVYVADDGNQRVEKFDTSGNFLGQWSVYQSRGIAVAPSGNVYVTTGFGSLFPQRVYEFGPSGAPIRSWGGSYGGCEGSFRSPIAVAVDPDGNVYVADRDGYRIEKFDADGNFLVKWGRGYLTDPVGITIDSKSNIYVTDTYGWVLKFHAPDRLVEVDVRPHECPNRLTISPGEALVQRRPMQVALLGSADLDVASIDLSTVRLEGVPPMAIRPNLGDVESLTGSEECHCGGQGPDGFADQIFTFDEKDVLMATVEYLDCVTDAETKEISFTARLKNGSTIGGLDCVVLGGRAPNVLKFGEDSPVSDRPTAEIESPNPMRKGETLSFSYQVATPCFVSVQLFSMSGRLVGTLAREFESAGQKNINWRGRNPDGGELPAGVYFLHATIGSIQISRKLTLL